jgi:hypothetical protein
MRRDLCRVGSHVGTSHQPGCECAHRLAVHRGGLGVTTKRGDDRGHADIFAALIALGQRFENAAVHRVTEIAIADDLNDFGDRARLDHQIAEQRTLSRKVRKLRTAAVVQVARLCKFHLRHFHP